jgi:hypothetical protein
MKIPSGSARETEASRLGAAAAAKEVVARFGSGAQDAELAATHHPLNPAPVVRDTDNNEPMANTAYPTPRRTPQPQPPFSDPPEPAAY